MAVTQSGTTGRLYLDGEFVGSNVDMCLNPDQAGGTQQNGHGRSQFSDPHLNGQSDDFRIYNGAPYLRTGNPATDLEAAPVAGDVRRCSTAPRRASRTSQARHIPCGRCD